MATRTTTYTRVAREDDLVSCGMILYTNYEHLQGQLPTKINFCFNTSEVTCYYGVYNFSTSTMNHNLNGCVVGEGSAEVAEIDTIVAEIVASFG